MSELTVVAAEKGSITRLTAKMLIKVKHKHIAVRAMAGELATIASGELGELDTDDLSRIIEIAEALRAMASEAVDETSKMCEALNNSMDV